MKAEEGEQRMGQFDHVVESIIAQISTIQERRRQDAESLATTADNMFGRVGLMIQELQPRLTQSVPDQKPKVSLSGWVKTENGATNTLKLKSATSEKDIPLGITFGQATVTVAGESVPSDKCLNSLAKEIMRFFGEY
jgi:hypothetical protein